MKLYRIAILVTFIFVIMACVSYYTVSANDILYKEGDNSPKIAELKTKLNKLGFTVAMNYPNNYGPQTKEAVKEFQNYYGLKSNKDDEIGIVDANTLDKLNDLLSTALMRGDRKDKVTKLKSDLNFLSYPVSMNTPNSYGPKTEQTVKNFQRSNGLKISGVAEEKVIDKIEELKSLPMKKGMRRGDVIELKENLNKLGFTVSMNYPNSYGAATEKLVKEFQRYYGLPQNGIADNGTLNKIDSLIGIVLKKGDRKDEVIKLKNNLNFLDFPVSMNTPNSYGPKTELAVKAFQKSTGLKVTGIVEEKMLNKIEELKGLPMRKGMRRGDVVKLKESLNKLGFTVSMNYPNSYGAATESSVEKFQKYYGLNNDGIAGDVTLKKLEQLLKQSLFSGKKADRVIQLKQDLNKLGFIVSMNYPNSFGPETEKAVKNFQKYYGLVISGVGEEVTLEKIQKILGKSLRSGNENNAVEQVKALKDDLINLGFTLTNDTNNFGPQTERAVRDFQRIYNLSVSGIAEEITLKKIDNIFKNALKRHDNNSNVKSMKNNLVDLGFLKKEDNRTSNFGSKTEEAVRVFQATHNLLVSGIVEELTLNKIGMLINNKSVRIFIDPGHGGRDPGASGNGLQEKNLTLDISNRIDKYLKQYKNVSTNMSRSSDQYLKLEERVKIANVWKADFFVSVHINSFTNLTANGFESFIYNGRTVTRDEEEKRKVIHNHIVKNISEVDRGMKRENLHVLRETNMSAVLFEFLFITNKENSDQLKKTSYRDKLARLTAEGIAKAYNLEKK